MIFIFAYLASFFFHVKRFFLRVLYSLGLELLILPLPSSWGSICVFSGPAVFYFGYLEFLSIAAHKRMAVWYCYQMCDL